MCSAGLEKKTNHSLRATGTSAMFHAGVPEKKIRDVTGHRSNVLHLYMSVHHCSRNRKCQRIWYRGKSRSMEKSTDQHLSQFATTLCNSAASVRSLPSAPSSGAILGSLFSGLGNCNITSSPQKFGLYLHWCLSRFYISCSCCWAGCRRSLAWCQFLRPFCFVYA